MIKRTKIVCTIGPACESVDILEKMVHAGMNVARLNFSHGTHENHAMLIEHIREVGQKTGEPIAILQDLQGPKIRVGILPAEGIELEENTEVVFDTALKEYTNKKIPLDYDVLHTFVKAGEKLLLNDGKFETKITRVQGTQIFAQVIAGGILTSHKGINVPDSTLKIRALTEKDKADALFGVQQGIDFMALSFVRTPEDVIELRKHLEICEKKVGKKSEAKIKIIAKIERREALENIEEIFEVVDGIMVARGDLGIEVRAEEVPLIQKKLIALALKHSKPVIVATQMLDSMQDNIRPTRAEVSDVANAVIDHTDAVMLSNETATGKFPVQTVETMAKIVQEVEQSEYDNLRSSGSGLSPRETESAIGEISEVLAERLHAKLIVASSMSGKIGQIISAQRPQIPLLVVTPFERVLHQLNLSWGVIPFFLPMHNRVEDIISASLEVVKENAWALPGDEVIVVSGVPGKSGEVNRVEVRVM